MAQNDAALPTVEKDAQGGLARTRKGLSWWQACLSMIVIVVGAGVLALPYMVKEIGWLCASLLTCLQAVMTLEGGMCMWRAFMLANENRGAHERLESYEDLARVAFGRPGEIALTVPIICLSIGIASVLSVLLAGGVNHIFGNYMGVQQALLVVAPVLAMLSLLPNVAAISKASPFGVVAITIVCGIIVVKSLVDAQQWQAWPLDQQEGLHVMWEVSWFTLGTSMSTLIGAFGFVPNVPSILCEMKDPTEFPKAFKLAVLVILALYLSVMNVAYYGYGEFMQEDIILSLAKSPADAKEALSVAYDQWTGSRSPVLEPVISVLLTVKLLIVIPLCLMVVFYSFQTLQVTAKVFPPGSLLNGFMRVSVVALAVMLGELVHDFGKLFSLVAALCLPFLTVIYPVLFYSKISKMYAASAPSWPRKVWHLALTALALFTMTFGTYTSLQAIVG